MNGKLKVLGAGVLFFTGQALFAQEVKKDTVGKSTTIEEVVLTGSFGVKLTPEQITGSTSVIKASALEKPTGISIDNLLQGQSAGVLSTASSGQPGASTITLIRGLTSLTGSNDPLYVLDGVPIPSGDISGALTSQNALSLINPSDIEDIQVLKDGMATSLYGSRGAAGVILIKTKSGRKGRAAINFQSEMGTSSVAYDKFEKVNAAEHIELIARARYNYAERLGKPISMPSAVTYATNYYKWDGVTDTDWDKLTRRNSPIYNRYNFSYSGSMGKVSIYSSLGYLQQEGIANSAQFDRYTGTLKTDWSATDNLKIHHSVNLSRAVQQGATDGSAFSNPIFTSRLLSPTQKPYNPDGTYNTKLTYLSAGFNPIGIQNENIEEGTFDKVVTSISAEYKFYKNLRFDTNFGLDYTKGNEKLYWNPDFGDGGSDSGNGYGYLFKTFRSRFTWNWYNFVHYNNVFADKHDVSISAGMEATSKSIENNSYEKRGFPQGTRNSEAGYAANVTAASSAQVEESLIGYVARVAYTYNKYLSVSGSLRRDGYSAFTDYWGNFFGAGVSFDFVKSNIAPKFFNTMKLRGSYGENGNTALKAYDKFAQYAYSGNYLSENGGYINFAGAPLEGLKWEKAIKTNIGLDFSFGKGSLNVYSVVDLFHNKGKDQLFEVPNPASSGFTTLAKNFAESYNKGIESTLGLKFSTPSGFSMDLKGMYTYTKSKITDLKSDTGMPTAINGYKAWFEGHNPTEYYLRLWAGVDPTNGDPLWYTDDSKTEVTNNSNKAKQYMTGKNAMPAHVASLIGDFNYKGFKVSFQFNYMGDYSVYDRWGFLYDGDGERINIAYSKAALYDSWTPENPYASRPKFIQGGNKNGSLDSTRYLYDGDHIRLKNVELGYRFTKDILNIQGINGVYVYLRATNLWTYVFDNKLEFDPESNSNAYTNTASNLGVYDQTQPNMKQYLFGLSIDF